MSYPILRRDAVCDANVDHFCKSEGSYPHQHPKDCTKEDKS